MDILKTNNEFLESTHFMVPVLFKIRYKSVMPKLSKTRVCDSLRFFPPSSF